MGRAPYQVLVLPFYLPSKSLADVEFLIFKRHPRSGAFSMDFGRRRRFGNTGRSGSTRRLRGRRNRFRTSLLSPRFEKYHSSEYLYGSRILVESSVCHSRILLCRRVTRKAGRAECRTSSFRVGRLRDGNLATQVGQQSKRPLGTPRTSTSEIESEHYPSDLRFEFRLIRSS